MLRFLLLLPLTLAACATTDGTVDDTDDTDHTDVVETDDTDAPTFTRVRNEVLNVSCALSTCHGAGEGSGELRLGRSAAEDHAELVGVPSSVLTAETRVIAGDAAGSYLVKKMEAAEGIDGDNMPPGPPLPEDVRQLVKDWIDAGALND